MIKIAKKGENKETKFFRFSNESLEIIDNLSIKYFGSTNRKGSKTLEEVIKRTAKDLGIELDEIIIRCADDLYRYYLQTANTNGKIMSVVETSKNTCLANYTIQKYRKELINKNKLLSDSTSAVYIVRNGDEY